ncbi:hypothetical protein BDW74DRAFT_181221 [Aspergillus multicolor]|uniref:uncharacterized protein n=1 Tax=Aspergillus multicolor TaxID=41759 RepID=UPI003CCDB76D
MSIPANADHPALQLQPIQDRSDKDLLSIYLAISLPQSRYGGRWVLLIEENIVGYNASTYSTYCTIGSPFRENPYAHEAFHDGKCTAYDETFSETYMLGILGQEQRRKFDEAFKETMPGPDRYFALRVIFELWQRGIVESMMVDTFLTALADMRYEGGEGEYYYYNLGAVDNAFMKELENSGFSVRREVGDDDDDDDDDADDELENEQYSTKESDDELEGNGDHSNLQSPVPRPIQERLDSYPDYNNHNTVQPHPSLTKMFGLGNYTLALGRKDRRNWSLVLIYPSERKAEKIVMTNAGPGSEYEMDMVKIQIREWHQLRRTVRFQTVARLSPEELATCLVPCFDQTEPGPYQHYIVRLLRRLVSAPYRVGSLKLVDEIQKIVDSALMLGTDCH